MKKKCLIALNGVNSKASAQIQFVGRCRDDFARPMGDGGGRMMLMPMKLAWAECDDWRKQGRRDPEGMNFEFVKV